MFLAVDEGLARVPLGMQRVKTSGHLIKRHPTRDPGIRPNHVNSPVIVVNFAHELVDSGAICDLKFREGLFVDFAPRSSGAET